MSAPPRPVDIAFLARAIDALMEEYPELADDAVLRADMLEGSTDLHEILSRIMDQERQADMMVVAIGERVKDMRARADRFARQKDAMRRLALRVMDAAHLSKVTLPEATLSIRAGNKSVDIVPDAEVPDEFCRIKREADKAKIREAIEAGTPINWATVITGPASLSVRIR